MAKFDLATRKAQLDRIVKSRDELERTTGIALVELLQDVMGKKKRLKVFDEDVTNYDIIYLNPSADDGTRTRVKTIVQAGGVFAIIPFDPDGDDEREEIALHELPIDARINLFQFLLDK